MANKKITAYQPKRPFREKQAVGYELSKDQPYFALLMEQRTGKSKIFLDNAAYQYALGAIDALLIVAWPAGVHRKWITDDLPDDLPDSCNALSVIWRADKANRVGYKAMLERLLLHPGLAVLSVNAEALTTESCLVYLRRFVKKRRIFLAADESTWMKTPGSQRTKKALALSRQPSIKFRRILDGTPGESPLDLFSQFTFLSPTILGLTSFYAFKARYAKFEEGYDPRTGRRFPKLAGFQNMDELKARLAPYVFRVRRDECGDMPPKVYQKRYFQLTKKQRSVYDELHETYATELSGVMLTASNVLVRYMRLQQVASNYWPGGTVGSLCATCNGEEDDCSACRGTGVTVSSMADIVIDEKTNPRADALRLELENSAGKPAIVWARFKHDIAIALRIGEELGRNPVRYDGSCNDGQKAKALKNFQSGNSGLLVGSQRAGGRGVKMTAAELMIYYSNDFPLLARLQSEDRAEEIGRTISTDIVDLVAEDTVDEDVVSALRNKQSLMNLITGDPERTWL